VILKFEMGIYKVQVSTTFKHVVAVTKVGRLFTWGSNLYGCLGHNNHNNKDIELRPKRVEHGGFVGLFIVCASTGHFRSAAIGSSGLVPIFCFSTILDIATTHFFLIFLMDA
jgi:alpha-tubulin suppressor-like RCC1 family protein